jgi:hypothetical protein
VVAFDRVLVSPTLLDLTEAFVEGQAALIDRRNSRWLNRAQWQEELPRLIEATEGTRDWEYGSTVVRILRLAWWTAPAGPRHFRLVAFKGKTTWPMGPPLQLVYPERIYVRWSRSDRMEWVFACPCGTVLPVEDESNAGGHCVGCPEPDAWVRGDHLAVAGRDLGRFRDLVADCRVVALSADGGVLARLTAKNRLIVARLEDGATLLDHTEGQKFTALALDAHGTALATIGEREVLEWRTDTETGRLRLAATLPLVGAHTAFFEPGGSLVALSSSQVVVPGHRADIVLETPILPAHQTTKAIALSPDGLTLAAVIGSTLATYAIACLARPEGVQYEQFRRLTLSGFSVGCLSPDACWLAWADKACGIHLHDLENNVYHGRAGWSPEVNVREARFDGARLWLRLADGTIHPLPLSVFPRPEAAAPLPPPPPLPPPLPPPVVPVARPPEIQQPPPVPPPSGPLASVLVLPRVTSPGPQALSEWLAALRRVTWPPPRLLIHAVGERIQGWAIPKLRELAAEAVTGLAMSPDRSYLAAATVTLIRLIRLVDGVCVLERDTAGVAPWGACPVAFSPDGHYIALDLGGRLAVFDIAVNTLHEVPPLAREGRIWSLAFTPNGALVVLRVTSDPWKRPALPGEVVYHSPKHSWGCYYRSQTMPSIQRGWLSPCSRYLAWVGDNLGRLTVRDLWSNQDLRSLEAGNVQSIISARFLPGGALIVAGNHDLELLQWRGE